MVDAGDLEPCTEYLVMIRWTLFFCGPLGDIVADNDIDAGEIEPCTEYLVMISWTLTTFLVMLLVTLLLVIL